jgi:hypothetical protein
VNDITSAFGALTDHLPPTILQNCVRCIENAADTDGFLTRERFLNAMASFTGDVYHTGGAGGVPCSPVSASAPASSTSAFSSPRATVLRSPSGSTPRSTVLELEKALFEARKVQESLRSEHDHLRVQLKEAAHINQCMTEDIVARTDRVEQLERQCREHSGTEKRYRALCGEFEQVKAELADARLQLERHQRSKAKLAADLRAEKKRAHLLSMEASASSDRLNLLMERRSKRASSLCALDSHIDADADADVNADASADVDANAATRTPPQRRRELAETTAHLRELQGEVARLHGRLSEEAEAKRQLEEDLHTHSLQEEELRRRLVQHRRQRDSDARGGTAIQMEDDDDTPLDEVEVDDDGCLGELHPDGGFLPTFDRVESPPGRRRSRARVLKPTHKRHDRDSICHGCVLM